jgi:peptidoglycan/LPS O-acetylase OafA/YrhL
MSVRVPYLDGLRALAILLVVTFHTIEFHPWLSTHTQWFWVFVLSQGHGVQLFFILSGFCLAYPTLERLQQSGAVRFDVVRFTSRRIVRIIPSYWIAIVTLIIAFLVLQRLHIHPGGSMPSHLSVRKIFEQAFLFNLHPLWLNGSFWTLPIEVHWYFVCPILLWVWTRSPKAFVTILLLSCVAWTATRFQAPEVKALPAFMLGIAAASAKVQGWSWSRYAPIAFVVLALTALVLEILQLPLEYNCWDLALFALVIAAGEIPALHRAFSARIFAPIAAASYSIYLVHAPVLGTVERYLPASIPPLVSLLIGGTCGVIAGLIFSLFAEKPFRYGRLRKAILTPLDRWLPHAFRTIGIEPYVALTIERESVSPETATVAA